MSSESQDRHTAHPIYAGYYRRIAEHFHIPFSQNEINVVDADAVAGLSDEQVLLEYAEIVGVKSQLTEGTFDEFISACFESNPAIAKLSPDSAESEHRYCLVLEQINGNKYRVVVGKIELTVSKKWLKRNLASNEERKLEWFFISQREEMGSGGKTGLSELSQLFNFLRPETRDVRTVVIFSIVTGLLSLATPLAVEAIVNTITFGRYFQPLLILSLIVFVFLAFRSALQTLMAVVVEIIQRRMFVRTVSDLASRIPEIPAEKLRGIHGPELFNQFFDVFNIQKITAKLLLDTLAVALQTVIGLSVLAFYHPFLLGYDIGLIAIMGVILFVIGRGAVKTAVAESKTKYKTAAWLQELSRHGETFKYNGGSEFGVNRADELAVKYLDDRKSHFRIRIRQYGFVLFMQAVAATVLLALGGYLVIIDEMTLGQLVAAELIVSVILGSFAKFGKDLESYYDLLASMGKLGQLFDLPKESRKRTEGTDIVPGPLKVEFSSVTTTHGSGQPLNIVVEPKERLAIIGRSGTGKSELIGFLKKQSQPKTGRILINNCRYDWLANQDINERIVFISKVEIFKGSIEENIRLGRVSIAQPDIQAILEQLGVSKALLSYHDGIQTQLSVGGYPLSHVEAIRIVLARGLIGNPSLILIDGLFDQLADEDLTELLEKLSVFSQTTFIVTSGRQQVASWADKSVELRSSNS